ncbi:MAG: pyrroline-5-carboxylate reductase, partial [Clostridia bacterium]|nr:pyrroline-5-carboxylate reductase [Clostridia bacterium]
NVYVYDPFLSENMKQLQEELVVDAVSSPAEIVETCQVIIPAVKPHIVPGVLADIADTLTKHHMIISIAAGVTTLQLKEMVKNNCYVIRTMPNTPALAGEGMTAVCKDPSVPDEYMDLACTILKSFGKVEFVSEDQIHAVTAISGSSPAYAFLFLEALADGGVLMGLSREQSYKIAVQSLLGAAKLMQETGKHPGELKDMVCSPSGTTIEAVAYLEDNGFRGTIIEAVRTCAEKSKHMGELNKS